MEQKAPRVRRGLFGLRSRDAERLFADREEAARMAGERIRMTQEQVASLEARVELLLQERSQLQQEVAEARQAAGTENAVLLQGISQEMGRVLETTQEAAGRILQLTRDSLEQHLRDADRRRRAADAGRQRLLRWSGELTQAADRLGGRVTETRNAVAGVRREIDEAVAAGEEAIRSLETDLGAVVELLDRLRAEEPADDELVVNLEPAPPDVEGVSGIPPAPSVIAPQPPIVTPPVDDHQDQDSGSRSSEDHPPADRVSLAEGWAAGPLRSR